MITKRCYFVFFITLCLACYFLTSQFAFAQQQPARVAVHTLANTKLTKELQLSGTVRSLRHAALSVAVAALVKEIHVDVGHRVKKADVLLTLDSVIADGEHSRAQAELKAAEVMQAEAQRKFKEAQQLRKQNHIGESEVKALENATDSAAAQLARARAELRIAKEQLSRHRLLAPFAGVISRRNTELGQWLNPGDNVLTLVSLEDVYLDVRLPQEYLDQVSHISSVSIRPDIKTNLQIPAQVETLVPIAEATRSFLLRIRATQASDILRPGVSAMAHVVFAHPEDALLLPRDALLRNVDGNYSVFVIENNQAKRRSIQLGGNHQADYWVKSGLRAGEHVVVRGNELLTDGQPVTVVEAKDQQP